VTISHPAFPPDGPDILETNRLYSKGLGDRTLTKYRAHFQKYVKWALDSGVDRDGYLHRPTEVEMMIFAQYLSRTNGAGGVNSTLAGVTAGFLERGLENPLKDKYGQYLPRLRRLIRGIKRDKKKHTKRRVALTVDKLRRLLRHILEAGGGSVYNAACYKAALTMGVYLLLRVGEMTSPKTREHDPDEHLNWEDVEILPSIDKPKWMEVHIKASKTDCYREGVTLKMFANGDPSCPVAAGAAWLKIRVKSERKQPLFVLADGTYVTRDRLQRVMKAGVELAGYDRSHFTTHSMRKGGATSLACANWPAETIMLLGRWSSDCYIRYLQMDDARRQKISASLAKVSTETLEDARERGLVGTSDVWTDAASSEI
jgi:hypothetical protein